MQKYLFISGDMIVTIESALPKREAVEEAVDDLLELMEVEDLRQREVFKGKNPVLAKYFGL